MAFKKVLFILTLILTNSWASAQLKIGFPVERIVFQRDNSDLGYIHIYGNVSQDCDIVEARLMARSANQGVSTPWVTIDSRVDGQAFSGKIQGKGGWYRLEVRGVKNGTTLFSSAVDRVGIGEVFLIAGQSNAQGYGRNHNARSAIDDRVNAYAPNYFDAYVTDQYKNLPDIMEDLSFRKVEGNVGIGPTGYSAYCYGELGDMLVNKLNVPVLFFNAAYAATSTTNWVQSMQNIPTYNEAIGAEILHGGPYRGFKNTLQNMNTLTGFRAVLWHQGEYDRFSKGGVGLQAPEYFNNLATIIQQSRNDIRAQIPWVVARASHYLLGPDPGPDPRVIEGQNMVINSVPNVWGGPHTDGIQVARYDGGHFQNVTGSMGLTQLAEAWNQALTEAFFQSSNPVMPRDILKIGHYCIGNGTVIMGPANYYNQYLWKDASGNVVSQQREYISGDGTYNMIVRDANGNVLRSNAINAGEAVRIKTVPVIQTPEGLTGCEGKDLRLEAVPSKYHIEWSNGHVGNALMVGNAGGYSARYKSDQNCFSASSQNYSVNFIPPPAPPQLTFLNGGGYKCDGETVTVAITNVQGADIRWSTGETTNQITLTQNTQEYVTATLYSLPNCPSTPSQRMNYRFYENPEIPEVSHNGPFYLLAASTNDPGVVFDWRVNGNEIEGQTTNLLHIPQAGNYQVRGIHHYSTPQGALQCVSAYSADFPVAESDNLSGFSIYPNPVSTGKIRVTSNGERENVVLMVIDQLGRELYRTQFDRLSYPRDLDLTSKGLDGKFFVVLKHDGQSKAFPILFVK